MGIRPDDRVTCARKGAMGGVRLGQPSECPQEPDPCPTKGLCCSLLEPQVCTYDGASVDQRMPQQGVGGWWEVGMGTNDRAHNVWAQWSTRMSSLDRDYLLIILISLVGV